MFSGIVARSSCGLRFQEILHAKSRFRAYAAKPKYNITKSKLAVFDLPCP